jgi:NADH-quinone oxidoreductase subunit M
MLFVLASIGLPGLNGFAGEFLILLGAFRERELYGILAAAGVVLGAVYMLVMARRIFFGPVAGASRTVRDLTRREVVTLVPLAILVIVLGVKPVIFTRLAEPAVAGLLAEMQVRTAQLDGIDRRQLGFADPALAGASVPSPSGKGTLPIGAP